MIEIPINIYQGESYNPPPISIVSECNPLTPIPLVGYTATMTVRQSAYNSNIVLQASTYTGEILIIPASGEIIISISADVLTPISPFQGYWDLFLYAPSGSVQRILGGPFNILESITQ